MTDTTRIDQLKVVVGDQSRAALRSALIARGVLLNSHAETLLDADIFDGRTARAIVVTERTVANLGRPQGATLSEILEL